MSAGWAAFEIPGPSRGGWPCGEFRPRTAASSRQFREPKFEENKHFFASSDCKNCLALKSSSAGCMLTTHCAAAGLVISSPRQPSSSSAATDPRAGRSRAMRRASSSIWYRAQARAGVRNAVGFDGFRRPDGIREVPAVVEVSTASTASTAPLLFRIRRYRKGKGSRRRAGPLRRQRRAIAKCRHGESRRKSSSRRSVGLSIS
jgi:hypothetical protein